MKTAFVTGSTRGIGRAIADRLHALGYRVLYSGTRPARPSDLTEDRDYVICDISDRAQREAAFAYVKDRFGRLDVMVNNAGVAPLVRQDILEMTEESFDRVIGINLKGTLFMCRLAAETMLKQSRGETPPRIINIGSISAYTSSTARGEYCISKAGISMVTQLMADRLAGEGIPVFEIRPGIIATDMTEKVHEKYAQMIQNGLLPIPRFGEPRDVADMVEACCSGLLDYAAGQVLNADGGFSLRRL
ncbi:MAG: 3-ketoacyl-ACP reductase [Clostridia bacterium]|nr:3-ketoacyl-ACP reductase [Clostridia bacterium]